MILRMLIQLAEKSNWAVEAVNKESIKALIKILLNLSTNCPITHPRWYYEKIYQECCQRVKDKHDPSEH